MVLYLHRPRPNKKIDSPVPAAVEIVTEDTDSVKSPLEKNPPKEIKVRNLPAVIFVARFLFICKANNTISDLY